MNQKVNGIVWKLMALLSVLSIGIGLFVMSPTVTYASMSPRYNLDIYVMRPTSSAVGSIRYSDTDNSTLGHGCLSLPTQGNAIKMVTYSNLDHILLELFPDGSCSTSGFPTTAHNVYSRVYKLGTPYHGHRQCCRLYIAPSVA